MPAGRPKGLTAKQQRFVDEYLIDLNATQAAIRAGYSEKTAGSVGNENLKKPDIAAAISKAQEKASERTETTVDRVLKELSRIGFSDLRKAFTANGELLHPQEWDDDTAAAIASVEVVTRQTGEVAENGAKEVEHIHKVKFWDKNSALDKIAKHLGMFIDRTETRISAGDGIAELMSAIDGRTRTVNRAD